MKNKPAKSCPAPGITTSKQAENALRESEAKFRTIFESFEDIYYQTDLNGIITLISPSVYRLSGWMPEELIGRPATLVYESPEDRSALLKAVAEQGYVRDYELKLIKRDGSRAMASLSAHLLYDSSGVVTGLAGALRDISERKLVEKALQESEEQFRSLFELLPTVAMIHLAGKVVLVNSECIKMFRGKKVSDFIGVNIVDYFAQEERDKLMAHLHTRSANPNGAFDHYFTTLQRLDGEIFPAEIFACDIPFRGSTASQVLVYDITERRKSEAALRKSEERYRTILDEMEEGYTEVDLAGNYKFVNEAYQNIMGYRKDELLGTNFSLYAAEEDSVIKLYRACKQMYKTGIPIKNFEVEVKRKDGARRTQEFFSSLLRDANDRPTGFRSIVRDITDSKHAQEELRKEKEFSQTLVQSSPIFFVAISSTGKTIMMNDSLLQALGYTRDEVVGMDYMATFVPESDRDALSIVFDQLTLLKNATLNENYILAKDGRRLLVEWHGRNVLKEAGEFDYFFGVGIDITDRRRMEEEQEKLRTQLTQAQKMESVGRLAGGVAHDFNNMLGVILGRAEIAMMKTDPTQPLYKDLLEIQKAAEHSAGLTRQLLAFARKQTVAPQVLDLNEIVEGMLKMLRRLIGEDIDLVWRPDAALWPVKMDPTQIDQILANLCVNARDAISGVGKVTIETGTTIFDEAHCANHPGFVPGDYALLAVSDNGCGIDKDTLDKLFEPFFTTKGVGKGTGLGLATVYGIVKQNNGFINVYSEPGQGTTFRIYLPRHVGKAELLRTDELADTTALGNETILLTEDEPAILEMTTLMLQHLGYAVLQAGTPGEAIRLAVEHSGQIHLLMTDVIMPEMNGRDLARNILSLYPDIKRLFMSGYTANTIAHHGVLDDGVHFIQKPFSLSNLSDKLREVLGKK